MFRIARGCLCCQFVREGEATHRLMVSPEVAPEVNTTLEAPDSMLLMARMVRMTLTLSQVLSSWPVEECFR